MRESYDYIIVGAGSAGCALAYRLSANPAVTVALLEAGGSNTEQLVTMPKGIAKLVASPDHTWQFPVQQPRRPGTPPTETWIRGKGLGGSSAINGMIFIRGQAEDYDEWERLGAPGWGWQHMREAFLAIEDHELGNSSDRGVGGPVPVTTRGYRYPLTRAMIGAGEQMGLAYREDLDGSLEGVGYYSHNIRNGRRVSAYDAFIRPVLGHRPNLHVLTGMDVEKVVFDGTRAVGVRARTPQGTRILHCGREVILSAGAMMSPVILQRSGVGDAGYLQSIGVPVVAHNPDVGQRFREHLGFSMAYRLTGDRGINHCYYGLGLLRSVLQYYLTRSGPMATGPFEVGAFVKSLPEETRPDLQLYLSAYTYARGDDKTPVPLAQVEREPGLTIYGQMLRLTSEGSVQISAPGPEAPVLVTPNWLNTEYDRRAAIAMVHYMRRFMSMPAIRSYCAEELTPGSAVESDEDILETVRQTALCGLHGVGTCRMGQDDRAVTDPYTRVRGVQGLRVADCSIMPGLVSGNTNAPAMALGWRAADLILQTSL